MPRQAEVGKSSPIGTQNTLMLNHAEKFATGDLGERVRFYITQGFANVDYQLPVIAHKLDINPRTLQRKLAEEGLEFQDLLTDARLQVSQYYLQHTDLSLREIALRVGFLDARKPVELTGP